MSFWESLKAGFLGAAGVDYYAKQTRDEVRGLRGDLRSQDTNPWDDDRAVQAAFERIHAGVVEVHDAMVSSEADELLWHGRISRALAELVDVLDEVDAAFPIPAHPRPDALSLLADYRAATTAFRKGATLWMTGDFENANRMVADGKRHWNSLSDYADSMSR